MNAQLMSSTLSPHRQQKWNAKVDTILETARAIMREQGVAALSMQELARRLDMRAPSLYHYFASKLDIYDALFRLGYQLYGEQLERAYGEAITWQETVRRSFETHLAFAVANPELFQLCFERPVPGFVPSPESMQASLEILERSYQRMQAFASVMQPGLTVQQKVDLIITMVHGITAQHMANEPDVPAGQGRFGALIPAALALLENAWTKA